MSRRPSGRGGGSGLPVPVYSRGSPANSTTSSLGLRGRGSLTHSTEDLPKQYGSSLSPAAATRRAPSPAARRSVSPGQGGRRSMLSPVRRQSQTEAATAQPGVRYITEDLIRKVAKEDNFDLITSLNLTLTKEGGKKIKYIENLEKLRKLQTLNLSHNLIEKIEKLDRLAKLRDLNLADNMLTKLDGLESLTALQSLNVSDNRLEHVPLWLGKKLKALRTFRLARNCLESLSEMAKLKPLPDLIQLDVVGNPLSDLPHGRLYVVFHLRTVEILDGQTVSDGERRQALQRFEQEEVEQLEKRLEEEESKVRQLEESHSKSQQERSLHQTSASELASKERDLQEKMKQMEQQLSAKDELLKKKTSDLNKASQKHYELEQELAFYKIDSKFDSLKEAPKFNVESADDSGDLQESPYIGRARYRANQFALESSGGASPSPQRASVLHSSRRSSSLHSPGGGGILRRSLSPPSKVQAQAELDAQLEQKHAEVQKTEAKLRTLQEDLSATERKLMNATTELKKISTDRVTPEPFRDDNKYKIRQRLARKMQKVNELRDQATQMEEEIDRKHEKITQDRTELHRLQGQLSNADPNSYGFERKQSELQEKEAQLNESSKRQVELQKELEEALTNIARETTDIKKLEEQLAADQIEQNDELRHELDDIVCGLSGYLENVKGQSRQHKHEFEMLIAEKEALEEKIRRMEGELNILEGEASNARWMQTRLTELEDSLRKTEDLNTTLQGEVERNRQRDPEVQERLKRAEEEAKQLRQTLQETEKKAEAERKSTQKQITSERERADRMTQKIQDVNRQELETKKLLSQLEAAKALNAGLRDQVEEYRHKQQMEEGGFKPSDLKKRLKKFTHEFKTNKNPIEPQGKNDILGMTFQDIQKHTQEQFDNSAKELQNLKKGKEKAEAEIQTLKEKMKKVSSKAEATKEEKKVADDNRRLQDEIKKLKKALEDSRARNSEGAIPVRIVYRPDSENGDRASSLNSDEKQLFDELQRELMDLKRNMRSHEDDLSKRLLDAETEAAQYKEEMKQKEKEFEAEMEEHRQAAELMREKQEARIQVIAQDLDQAQFVADSLQHLLEERERVLNDELGNADMSNQMISAQEDELARLYDILETQRDEIENLNQILDHLAQQGPDGVGAGFDDELWRIRQEVNNLKETLAMQSAYVQAMPGVGHMATQAGIGIGPGGVDAGGSGGFFPQQGSTQGAPVRASGAAAGTQVGGRPFGSVPTIPSKGSSGQANTTGATGRTPGSHTPAGGRVARPGSTQMAGAAMASTPMPRSAQSLGHVGGGEPRIHPMEHLGTERRESKAPTGGRPAVGGMGSGKAGDGLPPQAASRAHDRAFDIPGSSNQPGGGRGSRRSSRSRAPRAGVPSAFEPVHRPEPHHPYQTTPASVSAAAPVYAAPPPPIAGPVQPVMSYPLPAQAGPNRTTQTSGVQGAARGVQVGGNTQGFYPDMTTAFPGAMAPPTGPVDMGAGYGVGGAMPGPAYMIQGAVGEPAVAFDPVPQEISFNPGSVLHGFPAGQPGGSYSVGSHTYLPSGPAQLSHYGPGRMFVPAGPAAVGAGSQQQQLARIYYPAQRSFPMPAPGGTPMVPMAAGTPVKGGGGGPPTGYFDSSLMNGPPSPIRKLSTLHSSWAHLVNQRI
ncbi:hypothetical protein RRG08_027218 [Elysia crispata]|uniref:Centriolin n=1 Tax=Elysia crispata TaxID=231223 RepID=A0AAE1EE35_9GAST|nr:hypothetical protein RRG08_027218 [Elysia crispata]